MKSKSIPIIAAVVVLLLFGTAATCNMCGINYTTDTTTTAGGENKTGDTSSDTTKKEADAQNTTAAPTTTEETSPPTTAAETSAPTTEAQSAGSSPVIKLIEVTDKKSGTVYDALSEDIPSEWMNQLPVSLELFFHLKLSDPDNDKLFCNLSDSNGNNYEPVPVDSDGSADFYWTTPASPGALIMRFVIKDDSGMETVKELSFTFIQY
ncbi:MAG: hypothetical protein WCJ54_02045 [Actinomycetota bacterium]